MRESLRPGNEGDVLMKENTVRQVKELTTPDIIEPCIKADIVSSAPADMTAVCGNFGPFERGDDSSRGDVFSIVTSH